MQSYVRSVCVCAPHCGVTIVTILCVLWLRKTAATMSPLSPTTLSFKDVATFIVVIMYLISGLFQTDYEYYRM